MFIGAKKMFYRIFNDDVLLLKENNEYERYEKTGEKKKYGCFKLTNDYKTEIFYNEIQCRLLPKSLRNISNNVFMVSTENAVILLQSYDNPPKLLIVENNKMIPKVLSELVIGENLLHNNSTQKITSVDYLNNFDGKTYLKNYVFKIPINSGLIINGFFIYS
jgi:hypothetical protein